MGDSLYELLSNDLELNATTANTPLLPYDATTRQYLDRLTSLSLESLTNSEPASINSSSQSAIRSLQALSKRSHRVIIAATDHLSSLGDLLSSIDDQRTTLESGLPDLETAAGDFAKKYDRNTENAVLDRRKRAMQLNNNIDRVGNILELPSLLASTIDTTYIGSSTAATMSGYASALDVHAHVKRLKALYPDSQIVQELAQQSDVEIENLITVLISSLQSPSLKLAGAMRTIGWLRRVAPELAMDAIPVSSNSDQQRHETKLGHYTDEGSLGALFLVCRLAALRRTLEALEPLRELADQDTAHRMSNAGTTTQTERWSKGSQTERYLKRFIEIFREYSFAIISMYKSVFPAALPMPGTGAERSDASAKLLQVGRATNGEGKEAVISEDVFEHGPSALASFAPYVVDMLLDTLRNYLPNVIERSSRDSLLTQVLYCAGSLGRLGADFGMMLSTFEDEFGQSNAKSEQDLEPEWVQAMKKHKVQASRLELLASGVGSGVIRKGSTPVDIRSPPLGSGLLSPT